MKTRVYIDGANFYFGLLKNNPEWKWLDLKGLVALLVRSGLIRVMKFEEKRTDVNLATSMANHASYYRDTPRDLPAKCQLPDAIPVGTHGNFIRRPEAWR